MITFPTNPDNGEIYKTDKYDYVWDAIAEKWLQKQSNPSLKHKLYNDTSNLTLDLSEATSFEIYATGQSLDTEVAFSNPPAESGKFTVKVKNDYDLPKSIMKYSGNSYDFLTGGMDAALSTVSGVWFKDDGTRMFVGDGTTDSIYQFDLATAWDIQSRVYTGVNYDMGAAGVVGFQRFSFDKDGTRIFAVDTTSRLHQIDLTTAWDLSTAVDNDVSVSLETVIGTTFSADVATNVVFNYNDEYPGTKMFFIASYRTLYEVEMIEAWDIENAQYAGSSIDLGGLVATTAIFYDISINQDGTKIYAFNTYSTADYTVQINLNTAYSLSGGATYNSNFDFYNETGSSSANQTFFKPDFSKYWVASSGLDVIYEIDLSNPDAISSSTYNGNYVKFYSTTRGETLKHAQYSPDGKKLYVLTDNLEFIFQFDLRIPFDITSMVFDNKESVSLPTLSSNAITATDQFYISPDLSKVFVMSNTDDTIAYFEMTTPGDITTLTYVSELAYAEMTGDTNIYKNHISFSPDGTRLFAGRTTSLSWWDLSTPWDLSTLTYVGTQAYNDYVSETTLNAVYSIAFSARGDAFYFLEQDVDKIYHVRLSTPFDPSTGTSAVPALTHSSETSLSGGFALTRDSDKILVLENGTRYAYEYESQFSTQLSTSSLVPSFPYGNLGSTTNKNGLWAKPDGTRGYTINGSSAQIMQFDMTTPWDVTTYTNRITLNFTTKGAASANYFSIALSHEGDKLYFMDYSGASILYQYNLNTPWDITSAPDTPTKTLDTSLADPYDIHVSADGNHLFAIDTATDQIVHYTMTDGEIDTLTLQSDIMSNRPEFGVALNGDGTQVYFMTFSSGYADLGVSNLTTPYDLSTAEPYFVVTMPNQPPTNYTYSVYASPDGTHIGFASSSGGNIGFVKINDIHYTIQWPSNVEWENDTAPETPKLDRSSVIDFYTTDGGTTYKGIERISDAYNPTSLY